MLRSPSIDQRLGCDAQQFGVRANVAVDVDDIRQAVSIIAFNRLNGSHRKV